MRGESPSAAELAKLPPDGGPEFNRLVFETSPYLLQHARNQVDWYPWSDEAFVKARTENKPVFLSAGYSTCHWCHVMERQCFEKDDVAQILNQHYVAIKLDREEHPEIDAIYITATQLMNGHAGWPNSVWLTPGGKPFYAATYLPREQFKHTLLQLTGAWHERRDEVEAVGDEVGRAIEQVHQLAETLASPDPPAAGIAAALNSARAMYDHVHGGFGGSPKFPPHGILRLLADYSHSADPETYGRMFFNTLDAMAAGGIRDHLGGGFHRYSTDAGWLLPHFEKMLSDNARLGRAYTDAWLLSRNQRYMQVAVELYGWVLREMRDPAGGFWSAIDADSEGEEGRFYVWTLAEVQEVLGIEYAVRFSAAYGVSEAGNYIDEATRLPTGANVLHLPHSAAITGSADAGQPDQVNVALMRAALLAAREGRVRPQTDDKVLTSWNGLMIGSLAYAGRCLEKPEYVRAAGEAARFILREMKVDDRLLHSYRAGRAHIPGNLDDYAFLADALFQLHLETGEHFWLSEARKLVDGMVMNFADGDGSFFYTASGSSSLIFRRKDFSDDVLPSASSAAISVLGRLGALTGDASYRDMARQALRAYSGAMRQSPLGTASLHEAGRLLEEEGTDSRGMNSLQS